jgi:hypothetical protein
MVIQEILCTGNVARYIIRVRSRIQLEAAEAAIVKERFSALPEWIMGERQRRPGSRWGGWDG